MSSKDNANAASAAASANEKAQKAEPKAEPKAKTVPEKQKPAFKVKKRVTMELLKPAFDVPVYIRIESAIFQGKKVKGTGEAAKMEPAELVNITNLETGEPMQMIVPAVLKGILTEEYPQDDYVSRGFEVVKHPKKSGKNYHTFSVAELDL